MAIILNEAISEAPDMRFVNRGIAHLSDGNFVTVVHRSGAGFRVYHVNISTGVNTLLFTFTGNMTGMTAARYLSIVTDSSDNIHMLFRSNTDTIRYTRHDKGAGLTWTLGVNELVAGVTANTTYGRMDLDVLDSGVVIAMYMETGTSNPTALIPRVSFKARSSAGVWGSVTKMVFPTANYVIGTRLCSVARDLGGSGGGYQYVGFAVHHTTSGNQRPRCGYLRVELATGVVDTVTTSFDFSVEQVAHFGHLYSTAAGEFTFVGQRGHVTSDSIAKALYVRWNRTDGIVEEPAPVSVIDTTLPTEWNTYPTTALVGDTAVLVSSFVWGGRTSIQVNTYNTDGGWGPGFTWLEGSYSSATDGVGNEFMRSSSNRNRPSDRMHLVTTHTADGIAGTPNRAHYWYTNSAPAAPVGIGPGTTNASIVPVTTDRPTLTARSSTYPRFNRRYRARFQVDPVQNWTTPSRDITEERRDLAFGGGTHAEVVPGPDELSQDDWYMRAALIDEFGRQGTWTSGNERFTIEHFPAAARLAPANNALIAYGTGDVQLSWEFTDPSPYDAQTAYAVTVINLSTNTTVIATGKVVSTDQNYTATIPVEHKDAQLAWYVSLWDTDDVQGTDSPMATFRVGDAPVVTITSPLTGTTTDNPGVTINWTATTSPSRPAEAYMVAVSDLATTWESGWIAGTDTSYAIPAQVLQNSKTYIVAVYVRDTGGLTNYSYIILSTSWTAPNAPSFSVDTTGFDTSGYITISWSGASKDANFALYRIYRRHPTIEDPEPAWEMFYETSDNIANYNVEEWLVGSSEPYEYAVVQVATRFGVLVESVIAGELVIAEGSHYWLIYEDDDSEMTGYRIDHVISDDPVEEWDYEVQAVIGRGRVEDRGTRWGWSGNLQAQLRDTEGGYTAREKRQQILVLKATGRELFLRNPFGDVWKVSIGNIGVSRVAGVGVREYVTVDIPYVELA